MNEEIVQANFLESGLSSKTPTLEYVNEMSTLLVQAQTLAMLFGQNEVYNIVAKDYDSATVDFMDIKEIDRSVFTPTEAIEELAKELQLEEGAIYETMLKSERKARILSVLSYTDFVKRVNTNLKNVIATGGSYGSWYKGLKEDGIRNLVQKKGYWETVWRTNISTAFNSGTAIETERMKEYLQYQRYDTIIGEFPLCQFLTGQVRPLGGFGTSEPSNHYNCTGTLTPITKIRVKADKIKMTPRRNWKTNLKADKGFNVKPSTYLDKLPASTMKRLPKSKVVKDLVENKVLKESLDNNLTLADVKKTKNKDIEFHNKINLANATELEKIAITP